MPPSLMTLFAGHTQQNRLLRLTTPLGPERLLAESVHGEEGIGSAYAFTITALSLEADIPLRALLGQPALLELLSVEEDAPRTFHGYLTSVELNGANGGMARYTLTLQPWSAFLAHTRDSRIFQDKTVFDILEAVFDAWQGRGKLVPEWHLDIADTAGYPVRSLVTQYQESDLAFAERLIREAGLFYYFEHEGDTDSPSLGRHRMVIADHNGAFQPNRQGVVRFTQPGTVMREDSIDRWRRELRPQANVVEIGSWDYRARNTRPVTASGVPATGIDLVSRDMPGHYAYASRSEGQRMADRRLQALEAGRDTFIGAGTVRTLAPGTTFTLSGHAVHDREDIDARNFLVTRVRHRMYNNLSADLKAEVAKRIGAPDPRDEERPLYRNRIDAIRAALPYRMGGSLPPRPTVRGQQTAIVVGPENAVIHTDRDHRIKIQFHWQRDAGRQLSHNRLSHPFPDGHTGAPGDDRAGTWVRVATPLAPIAGANWGSHALPRVGQEVLVDFLDGDIDRPVVIGALRNGRGQADAQHNQVSHGAGTATGNAPPWFPGENDGHGHAAVLSGLKSQAMASSQSGAGAYSQLVFDDSPGQARIALQRHARAHAGTDELNLGHLRHQVDNQRLQPAGFGAELKSAHSVALRAGQGMLLTTDRCAGPHMDAHAAKARIEAGHTLQASLASAARKHNAGVKDAAEPLAAVAQMQRSAEVLGNAFNESQLQLSSPAGIVVTTPAHAILNAGAATSIVAEQDINLVAQGNSLHAVAAGISLFTYGKAGNADKPNQETGMRLHAASGKLCCQSQSDAVRITADKAITVASVTRQVKAVAKTHVLLTAQGACLKLEGGDIMLHAPGKVEFKASMKELAGPADGSVPLPAMPKAEGIYNEAFVVLNEDTKAPMAHVRYRLESASGVRVEGITDALGRTQRIFTPKSETLTLHLPDDA